MEDLQQHESSNPPYDGALKEEIEQRLGIHLPVAYVDLLKRWNGGYFPTARVVKVDNPVPDLLQSYLGDGFWGLSSLPGIARDAPAECNLIYLIESAIEWGLPSRIVPLEGDGHTWVALDYRDVGCIDPPIIFIESDNYQTFSLAKDFAEFRNVSMIWDNRFWNLASNGCG